MKIIHIIPALGTGGAEKFVIDLCNEQSKKHEVSIYSLSNVTNNMILVDNLNKNVKVVSFNKKLGPDLSIFFKIFFALKKDMPDVVNTHTRGLLYTSLAIFALKIKCFHTVHNLAKKEVILFIRFFYKILFKFFSVVPISISNKVQKSVEITYGKEFTEIVCNGTARLQRTNLYESVKKEINLLKKTEESLVFTTIGRISPQKNFQLLIDTIIELNQIGIDAVLLIIGEDKSKGMKNKKELLQNKSKNIHFFGAKTNVADYLLCSDGFCLSSLYEGMPITLLESLSVGTIPICTPAGGIPDVINDEVGFVSTGFDKKSYKETFQKFLELSFEEKLKKQSNCIDLFEQFYSISICAKNYENLYKK